MEFIKALFVIVKFLLLCLGYMMLFSIIVGIISWLYLLVTGGYTGSYSNSRKETNDLQKASNNDEAGGIIIIKQVRYRRVDYEE